MDPGAGPHDDSCGATRGATRGATFVDPGPRNNVCLMYCVYLFSDLFVVFLLCVNFLGVTDENNKTKEES